MKRRRDLCCALLLTALLVLAWAPSTRAQTGSASGPITIQVDHDSASVVAGDWIAYRTELRNEGTAATPPLVAHFEVTAIDKKRHVDPEDWSPERTQFLKPLQPGASIHLDWRVHVLMEGEFASFITVVAPPGSFAPVTSPAIYIRAQPDDILPVNEVIPVVAVIPLVPLALLLVSVAPQVKGWFRDLAARLSQQ